MNRDGIFKAAEPFKCKKCRRRFPYGTQFVLYTGGEKPWWGCLDCAGIYLEMVRPNQRTNNGDDSSIRNA